MTLPEGRPLREVGENGMVSRFRRLAAPALPESAIVGPGDDAAAIKVVGGRLLLLTCDMMVEGVHFRREWATAWQIGWKAMAQNVSDIAAMGGEPAAAVCSVGAPGELAESVLEGISEGLIAAASRYGAAVVGGDLVGSPEAIIVDVALTGWVEEGLLLRRRGARPGDVVAVTGRLGASGAGLAALRAGLGAEDDRALTEALRAHREPSPRLAEARAIALTGRASAMMDVSDGLVDDLPRLCGESGVGARIHTERIPIADPCLAVAQHTQGDALQMAVSGGEDYELLFTCPPHAVGEITRQVSGGTGCPVSVIGEIVEGKGVVFLEGNGREVRFASGFDHFARSSGT